MSGSLFGVASIIAGLTLLSKALGFGRELVVAGVFGAGVAKDAYTAAYIIPSFSLIMLGGLTGPFHTATQRILATLKESEEKATQGPAVMAAVAVWVTVVMGGLAAMTFLLAPWMIRAVASQASLPVFDLAVQQLRIMAPLILLGGWVGLLCGISNEQNDFARPSLSPLIASVAIIAVILVWPEPLMLAYGTLLGGLGQVLLQLPAAVQFWRDKGLSLSTLPYRHPAVRSVWQILLPACVSSGVGTLSVVIGTNFASALEPGSISIFDFANKLIQLPLGILMTALLIPIFPLLTRAVVAQDRAELSRRLAQGISTVAVVTFPLSAWFVVSGYPLVRVIFERGAFERGDTRSTGLILGILALGIAAYATRDLMVRVFYAHNDGRTPLLVSLGSLGLTVTGMAWVVGPYGLAGLAGVTVAATALSCVVLAWLLRRRLGHWAAPGLATLVTRALISALLAGGIAHWAVDRHAWELSARACLTSLALETVILLSAYAGILSLLGVPVFKSIKAQGKQLAQKLWKKAS